VVRPDGTVVVPYVAAHSELRSVRSTDGGTSFTASVPITTVRFHDPGGRLRTGPTLPSAAVDAAGRVYLAWSDCRFQAGCRSDDLVYATSDDGLAWGAPVRVPAAGGDAVLPGIAADPTTGGPDAHLALYYYVDDGTRLRVGYRSSVEGGRTWTAERTVAGPFDLSLVAKVGEGGRMVGDYLSGSIVGGDAVSVFAVARPAATGTPAGAAFDQGMYTAGPVPVGD
jgi:hypothetical protein